jgi:hypothetical protein
VRRERHKLGRPVTSQEWHAHCDECLAREIDAALALVLEAHVVDVPEWLWINHFDPDNESDDLDDLDCLICGCQAPCVTPGCQAI